ncbi:hypothetical protein RUM43_009068 [Polyplax serrata]|uniref:Integrin beta n=1 Tax=Polyplax serrata TaxID=468196 RepID=A0AAN8NPM5_POLSC
MSLSKETDRFSVEVETAEMSGNIDTPEGVLDGLMQAMVCQKELNWREKARHIIVVSTDAPFHLAGDGKLGGIVEPNDELCHLDDEGYYTHSLAYDYPSVSQINHQSLGNNMNVIFAVVNKVKHEYHSLVQEIRGASLGLLDAGENIADLIKGQYEKISTTIRLTENSRGAVNVGFSARCTHDDRWKIANECNDVKGGSLIHFKVHLSVTDCSSPEWYRQDIQIKPEGINETLTIHLETLCDCECSKKRDKMSTYCSNSGDLVCGVCICPEGEIGQKCECTGYDTALRVTDTSSCVTNNETHELCSGRGECKCGVCQCHSRKNPKEEITGKHCECDNFSCERVNGVLCTGHGTCKCGKCVCDHGWSEEKCDCPTTDEECRDEAGNDVCSGRGTCVCGVCHCHNGTQLDEHRYSGKYCQNCVTCLEQCDIHNECVECLSHDSGPLALTGCTNCSNNLNLILVDSMEEIQNIIPKAKTCVSLDEKGCTFRYLYTLSEGDRVSVWAEKVTWCPKQVNLIAVISGTIGCTILIGLLSLIAWKVLTDLHDKREYEKFERERHLAHWGREENPLFKTATTTYENPTYELDSCQPADQGKCTTPAEIQPTAMDSC